MASISLAKGLRRSNARLMAQQETEQAHRKIALKDRLRRHGLAGQRLGKHKVPERQIELQLGEDLTENLRGLKVNRFFSLSILVDSSGSLKGIFSKIGS